MGEVVELLKRLESLHCFVFTRSTALHVCKCLLDDPNRRFANVEDTKRAIDAAKAGTASRLPKTRGKAAKKAAGLSPHHTFNFVYLK